MRTSYRSTEPKGIEDHLKDLCLIYRGEIDNPHDVNALMDEERMIQILKYSLWDVERSILEAPASWRYLYLEEKGKLSTSPNGNGGWFISLKNAGLLRKKALRNSLS